MLLKPLPVASYHCIKEQARPYVLSAPRIQLLYLISVTQEKRRAILMHRWPAIYVRSHGIRDCPSRESSLAFLLLNCLKWCAVRIPATCGHWTFSGAFSGLTPTSWAHSRWGGCLCVQVEIHSSFLNPTSWLHCKKGALSPSCPEFSNNYIKL